MSDGDLLLRGILENPACDAARLVYADYLDERGESARAELIRLQIAHSRDWGSHPLKGGCRCASCRSFRREEKLLSRGNTVKWAGAAWAPATIIRWYRGFVETVELPLAAFVAPCVAGSIFAEQPVTQVWLNDRAPQRQAVHPFSLTGWCKHDSRLFRIGDEACLPVELFDLLDGKPVTDPDGTTWCDYDDEVSAFAGLSRAAVVFGRAAAGLPELLPADST